MDFDPTPCKHSGVRLLEIVPPSRGVRVAGEVRSNTFVHPPCPSPSGDDRTDHVPDDDAENGSCDTAHEQAKQADHTAMTRDCLVRWCNITSDRLQVLLLLHRDARGGFVMHPDGDDGANACSNESQHPFMTHSESALVAFIVAHRISQDGANKLLRLVRDVFFNPADITIGSWNQWVNKLNKNAQHGLTAADVNIPHYDRDAPVPFIFRSAWDIAREFVRDPAFAPHIQWECAPVYNQDGDRVYGELMSARWIEEAYAALQDPEATILVIILGSDAAQMRTNLSAHPIYATLGNLPTKMRMCRDSWKLCGFIPSLDRTKMDTASQWHWTRAQRVLFQTCIRNVLAPIKQVFDDGGLVLRDWAGISRKIMPKFGLYVTDRLEHEMVCLAWKHACFHCDCPPQLRDDIAAIRLSCARDMTSTRTQLMGAAATGVYPGSGEAAAKPILKINERGRIEVVSQERYDACARSTNLCPEYNLLWDMADNIYLQCQDDPLHHVALGIMPKVQQAILSKYIHHLHPPWALANGIEPGASGILAICRRIGSRLKHAEPLLKDWVSRAFERGFAARVAGHWQLKWSITGAEHLDLFGLLPFCLGDLVKEEVAALNRSKPPGVPPVVDPSREIVTAVCAVLDWNEHISASSISETELELVSEEGLAMMQMLKDIFPSRATNIPSHETRDAGRKAHKVAPQVAQRGPWLHPKHHQTAHRPAAVRLFGW